VPAELSWGLLLPIPSIDVDIENHMIEDRDKQKKVRNMNI
jgi:hypothetical protein